MLFSEYLIYDGAATARTALFALSWYLTTHYPRCTWFNVDIVANSEDQAKTSFDDIYEMLDDTWDKSQKFFHKTKELITNTRTRSYIKFNTSNAKTKDGKRSACLIFDEIHGYAVWDIINVFRSGFASASIHGVLYHTDGYVRDGVLDQQLSWPEVCLDGEIRS